MAKNDEALKHIVHLEELLFLQGNLGIKKILRILLNYLSVFSGRSSDKNITTIKIDGKPAIVFGKKEGKFYISTKSAFNKEKDMLCFSEKDVEIKFSGELEKVLKAVFSNLSKLSIKQANIAYQGDLLFSSSSQKKVISLDTSGNKFIALQPNTIIYAFPLEDPLAKKIISAKIGISIHTVYPSGLDSSPIPFLSFKDSSDSVFILPHAIKDYSGVVNLTKEETNSFIKDLQKIKNVKIESSLVNVFKEHYKYISKFINKLIENDQILSAKNYDQFISYLEASYKAELEARKSDKGKSKIDEVWKEKLHILRKNRSEIENIFDAYSLISSCKEVILHKLNSLSKVKTMINKGNSIESSTGEGFVAFDNKNMDIVKFVSRLEFSKFNRIFNSFNKEKKTDG